jgi:hypothetical protein
MMHPDRMPSLSLGIIVPVGAAYDPSHHWRTETGALRASVGFQAGGYSHGHLQGEPAALRELAAALTEAAERAEQASNPTEQTGDPAPAPAVVEGVAG